MHVLSVVVPQRPTVSRPTPRAATQRVLRSPTTRVGLKAVSKATPSTSVKTSKDGLAKHGKVKIHGVHHVALLCENLETSLAFYRDILGLEINPDRPHDKLPYRGAWLWIGPEMIHLMELPNPDPLDNRPQHGGRDRHFCIGVESIEPIETRLKEAGVEYTRSMSGRAALFFRDPDSNCLECVEQGPWR